jgi:hypothetical protein
VLMMGGCLPPFSKMIWGDILFFCGCAPKIASWALSAFLSHF